jgi:hypothetical protein
MAITKTQTPYEFLVRWKDGKISGAHVKFLERVIDEDGSVLSEKEDVAVPVSMAGEAGYPIADVFAAIHEGAVATAQDAVAAIAEAQAKEAEASAAADVAEKECVRLKATQESLQALTEATPH